MTIDEIEKQIRELVRKKASPWLTKPVKSSVFPVVDNTFLQRIRNMMITNGPVMITVSQMVKVSGLHPLCLAKVIKNV